MDFEKSIILFVFIILIFIALYILKYNENISQIAIIISVISAIFIGYLFNVQEFFTANDNYEISKYNNISTSEDIDMTKQEEAPMPRLFLDNTIDNSDVIEMAITKGTTLFQPNGTGFSPLKGIADIPKHFNDYDIPLSGQQNVDEMLSRKQQQRAATNKRALDGAVRATKELYNKYFQEELDENEKRVWYSSEAQDIETDWNPY